MVWRPVDRRRIDGHARIEDADGKAVKLGRYYAVDDLSQHKGMDANGHALLKKRPEYFERTFQTLLDRQ